MNDQFTKQFTDMFKANSFGQIPGQMQSAVQDGIAKTRDVTLQSIAAVRNGAETFGKSNMVAPKESGALTSRVFEQAIENTEAMFLAMQAMTQAKSPMEAMQLQAKFVQTQFAKAGEQTKELFELSTKVSQKTAEAMGGMVTKGGPFKI